MTAIDDMLPHDHLLERYPWLSPQILNRWRRQYAIKTLRGKDGKPVYLRHDLENAISQELTCDGNQPIEDSSNIGSNGSTKKKDERDSIDTGTMSETDALREKLFLRSISKTPKKNFSKSSAPQPHQAATRPKSISSMS